MPERGARKLVARAAAAQDQGIKAGHLLATSSDGLQPSSVLAPSSNGLHPSSFLLLVAMASKPREMAST